MAEEKENFTEATYVMQIGGSGDTDDNRDPVVFTLNEDENRLEPFKENKHREIQSVSQMGFFRFDKEKNDFVHVHGLEAYFYPMIDDQMRVLMVHAFSRMMQSKKYTEKQVFEMFLHKSNDYDGPTSVGNIWIYFRDLLYAPWFREVFKTCKLLNEDPVGNLAHVMATDRAGSINAYNAMSYVEDRNVPAMMRLTWEFLRQAHVTFNQVVGPQKQSIEEACGLTQQTFENVIDMALDVMKPLVMERLQDPNVSEKDKQADWCDGDFERLIKDLKLGDK